MESETDLLTPLQAMFVVPKRNFKRANDRNKLKRRMREAYRLNKNSVYEQLTPSGKQIIVAFIYTGKQQQKYKEIESAILKLLGIIVKKSGAAA